MWKEIQRGLLFSTNIYAKGEREETNVCVCVCVVYIISIKKSTAAAEVLACVRGRWGGGGKRNGH